MNYNNNKNFYDQDDEYDYEYNDFGQRVYDKTKKKTKNKPVKTTYNYSNNYSKNYSNNYSGNNYGNYGSNYSRSDKGEWGGSWGGEYDYNDNYDYTPKTYSYSKYASYYVTDSDSENLIYCTDNYIIPQVQSIKDKLGSSFSIYSTTPEEIYAIKELCVYHFTKMIEGELTTNSNFSYSKNPAETEEYITKKTELYDTTVSTKTIVGNSAMERAISTFIQMRDDESDNCKLSTIEDLEEETAACKKRKDKQFVDPEIDEIRNTNQFTKTKGLSLLKKISLITDFGKEFSVSKEIKTRVVSCSDEKDFRKLRGFQDLFRVNPATKLMPDYKVKMIQKMLRAQMPIVRTAIKQKIIIIVDYSGSMGINEKQEWVAAIILDRIKYVLKGECELFFSYFEYRPDTLKFTHVHDMKSAQHFWANFSFKPSGGGTDVGAMIDKIENEINVHKKLMNLKIDLSTEMPEILVINDGQDSIKTEKFKYKTNAICIEEDNHELRKLCLNKDNKGKYINIGFYPKKITAYNHTNLEVPEFSVPYE